MGAFYGNITLKGPSPERVAESLRGRRAIVALGGGPYTVTFDSVCDDQDVEAIRALTSLLSSKLRCAAFAVIVHDDDLLMYFLFCEGDLSDSYNSVSNYFDSGSPAVAHDPVGGDADSLCSAFNVETQQKVHTVLRKPHGRNGYVSETDRHRDLVRLLKLPEFAVGKAFASFERGEYPDGLSADQLLRAADPPPLEDPQRRRDRRFYDKLGDEDASRPCRRAGCGRGALPLSVLCKRHHFEMVQGRDCPFED